MDKFGVKRLFIKSAERSKTDLTGIYKTADLEANWNPRDEKVFISTPVNFVSEWRVFVFRSRIVDARPYTGNHLVAPNESRIKKMVEAMGDTLHAYTLDVGVTNSGETVVVEVHNFIACGLYGANIPLGMYRAAYQKEFDSNAWEPPHPTSSAEKAVCPVCKMGNKTHPGNLGGFLLYCR